MSDTLRMVSRLFSDHTSGEALLRAEAGEWPAALWDAVIDAGLHLALVDRGDDSLELPVADAFGIVRLAGHCGLPIPLPETMLANWLLARLGKPLRNAPAVIARAPFKRVPWGRRAVIVAVDGDQWGLAERPRVVRHGASIAGEPRDDLACELINRADLPEGIDADRLYAASAALRCAQMAGALESLAALTVGYATQRVQFGKPLSKFQAIQHSAAVLATQAAAAGCAADLAAEAFADGIQMDRIAAAKTYCGGAVAIATGLAHQIHGAMGFSREHSLHHRTRRLWSWREEYGSDTQWAERLGASLARAGADSLWAEITAL